MKRVNLGLLLSFCLGITFLQTPDKIPSVFPATNSPPWPHPFKMGLVAAELAVPSLYPFLTQFVHPAALHSPSGKYRARTGNLSSQRPNVNGQYNQQVAASTSSVLLSWAVVLAVVAAPTRLYLPPRATGLVEMGVLGWG